VPQSSAARIPPVPSDVPSFDVVDAITPVGTAPCAECRGPIVDTYFETDAGVICEACHTRLTGELANRTPGGQFSRALGFGAAAALAGAAIYFGALAAIGREISLVILLVGFLVGKSVRLGARGRGGRRMQWLAIGLTYLAIASTYLPFVLKGFSRGSTAPVTTLPTPATTGDAFLVVGASPAPTPPRSSLGAAAVDLGALLLLALAAPVLEGANHLSVLLVFVLALVTAWRMNRRTTLTMTGPYRVRTARV
jgi:hypothetical protein